MQAVLSFKSETACALQSRARSALILGLFFVSGTSALIYEVVWFKRLAVVWGNSTLASGAVTAAFMLGLSAGAWIIGLSGNGAAIGGTTEQKSDDSEPRPQRFSGLCGNQASRGFAWRILSRWHQRSLRPRVLPKTLFQLSHISRKIAATSR